MTPFNTLAILLLSLVTIPVIAGICIKAPKLVVYGFIAVLFMFSSSTWGQLEAENTIYSRGTGLFYFSLLNILLLIAGASALIRKLANPYHPHLAIPWPHYFLALVFLLFSHIILGKMSGVELPVILGHNGIFNIFNMLVFMYLLVMALHDERDKRNLLLAIILLAGIRTLFGLVRYIWFDGDSANPYRNFEGIDIKIFFFDIGDNFISALAAFCAAWLLTTPQVKMSLLKRLFLYGYLLLEIAAIALSFRRSSLIGLILMFAFLLCRLPMQRRILFGVVAAGLLTATTLVLFQNRLQVAGEANSILMSLVYDITGSRSGADGRFYELYAAAKSMEGNWLFGLGTWGRFSGDPTMLDYHFGRYDFVHSGLGHIILKTGLVGLALFCCMLFSYAAYYFRHRKSLSGNSSLLADAGFAGFLFWIPTLLVGTPIIEFRTMLLLGMTLAMPFIAVGLKRYQAQSRYVIA